MPKVDGREAFAEIARICDENRRPTPPVIFCTGFMPPESLTQIIATGGVHCLLRKPVRAATLLQAVRERL
jgi:CheY-like chemotaxis protein